jgi:hypothetical protein
MGPLLFWQVLSMPSDGPIVFAVAAMNEFLWMHHIGNISKVYLEIYVLPETHHLHYNIVSKDNSPFFKPPIYSRNIWGCYKSKALHVLA